MNKLAISSVCKVFETNTVGTKADNKVLSYILDALMTHDVSKDRAPGQHFIKLPDAVLPLVSAGVGLRTDDPSDYVVREWRGRCELFLRREKSEGWKEHRATGVAAIVYTREAYGKDPDVSAAELEALGDATHVLVAHLAFAGPASPPAPWTFIRNLAGANNEELQASGDDIRAKAKAVHDYYEKWCVVADALPVTTGFIVMCDDREDGISYFSDGWTRDRGKAYVFPTQDLAKCVAYLYNEGEARADRDGCASAVEAHSTAAH